MPKGTEWDDIPTNPSSIERENRKIEGTIVNVKITAKLDWQTREPVIRDGKEMKQVEIDFDMPFSKSWDPPYKTVRYTVNGKFFRQLLSAFYDCGVEIENWTDLEGETFLFEEVQVPIPGKDKPWDVYYPIEYIEK